MKPIRYAFVSLIGACLLIIACTNPLRNASGTLTVTIGDGVSRTLLPAISMDPASYDIEGSGPGGASFSLTITGESQATIDHLAFASWTVTVTAKNADGTSIGTATDTVDVHTNQTSTLDLTVVPFDGVGTLALDLSWPAAQVENAQVEAQLVPASGARRDLTFNVNDAAGTADFSADDVASGYHALALQLLDNGALTMGAVEVVRIVADQTTSGSFTFDPINQPGGTIDVSITPELNDPLVVAIAGASAEKGVSDTMTLTASNADGVNATYVWYVNGVSQDSGDTFAFDDTWALGHYRIDVTVFTTDGLRAGSASAMVDVVESVAPPALTLSANVTTLAGSTTSGSADGTGLSASFNYPEGITTDGTNLYVADTSNHEIRKVVIATGVVTTLAGSTTSGSADGTGSASSFNSLIGITTDGTNLYVADTSNHEVRKIE